MIFFKKATKPEKKPKKTQPQPEVVNVRVQTVEGWRRSLIKKPK
jgi:hypothetical protein